MQSSHYVGRFAPSPSGPLHFGSLVSALASYLDARASEGWWLIRMDDIDPPREQKGAAKHILYTLKQHGLVADQPVLLQSTRHLAYRDALDALKENALVYACNCTRKTLALTQGIYNGHCRNTPPAGTENTAVRLKLYNLPEPFQTLSDVCSFTDILQGLQTQNLALEVGDAVVYRKDQLFAYQLAVAVDDIFQGITHVIRGCDLLNVTARQIRLIELLGGRQPTYGHVPIVVTSSGLKLSKQNHAEPVDNHRASNNLWRALCFLGQNPPSDLATQKPAAILSWATQHWQLSACTGTMAIEPHRHTNNE